MIQPNLHIQRSGHAQLLDNSKSVDATVNTLKGIKKEKKEIKQKNEDSYIQSQEELMDMVGQAHGRDQEAINKTIMEAHEQLTVDYESGSNMNSPEYLKKKFDNQLTLQQSIEKSKAYQEQTVQLGKVIEKGKYIDKQGASAAIRAENEKSLNDRDSNLAQSIIDGDQYYKFDDEAKDIAFALEMTNEITDYDKYNTLNQAHRQGFEYNDKTQSWGVSQQLEDRILNGDMSSDRFKKRIKTEGQKIADSKGVSIEEGKRMFLNNIMEKHAGNKQKVDGKKIASTYRPPASVLSEEALVKKYDEASSKLMVGDEKALAPFTAIKNSYGWKIEEENGKMRITYRTLTKYGSKTNAKADGATDKYLRAGQWFDPTSKGERHSALSPLFKALDGKYLPYGGDDGGIENAPTTTDDEEIEY